MTPIPIAVFIDRYIAGGTQRQMIELLRRLDRRRFRVHPVCCYDDGPWTPRVAECGDPITAFPIQGFRRAATMRQMGAFARWCRANRIALVHTWEIYSNIFGLTGAALAGVPVRIGSRRGLGGPRGARALQRYSYRLAHRMVANSQAAARQLVSDGTPVEKVLVIPNGIDLGAFPARKLNTRPRRITMVGCLREGKRVDVLISAAVPVLARFPDAEFVIAGDGRCREALVAQARDLGVGDRVRFLGHRDDVPAVLSDADIFVLPSESEASPNVVIEAMAAGLPVVACKVGGIPELVAEGVSGTLVRPGDPDVLAEALIDLLESSGKAIQFGRAGRTRVEQQHSFDRMVDRFEDLYISQLERAQPRSRVNVPGPVSMKSKVKSTLMTAYLESGFPAVRDRVARSVGRSRLTVLAYHQVKDPADDGSSVGTAAFREQMEYLRNHYRLLPLTDAVARMTDGPAGERLIAVTFDDGYLDNYTAAAPIMKQVGVPGTFFVSTDMIGSTQPFPHDTARNREAQLHMSWDDVRALAADGFEIGSHTCSHADLGAIPLHEAEHELRLSRERLETELHRPVRAFAFPYGRRHNMRAETLAAAQREYDVCCSAYGGHNSSPIDPGHVRRIIISSGVTLLAFRALLEGWPMLRLNNPTRRVAPPVAGLAVR